MALKNTSEALFNRNQILNSFEQAQNTGNKEERRRLMTFAIVGGGATGIELAGALAEDEEVCPSSRLSGLEYQ